MKFTKMHGCGNDYIYVNGFEESVEQAEKPQLARRLSDRHFGVGGDGLIFINPSFEADFEMEMYNADGSRAEMCGNGIRCVAKYVYDKGLTDSEKIRVVSAGKVKLLELTVERNPLLPGDRGRVSKVRVNMGSPVLEAAEIPVMAADIVSANRNCAVDVFAPETGSRVIDEPILLEGTEYRMTCVSMGNPHAVIFMPDVRSLNLEKIGPLFENHPRFPRKVNTEFVEILDRKTCFMRVWERGSGETLACGTGCCATVVAGVLNNLTESAVTVKLLGGELFIEWDRERNQVYMTGPATTVYEGIV